MKELIRRVKMMISNLLTRATIKLIVQDESKGKTIVQVSGLSREIRSDIEHIQQYGFRSMPEAGARGIWAAIAGGKSNGSIIVVDDKRYGQFELQVTDTCIYSKNGAHTIYRDNDIIETLSGTRTIKIGGMTMTISSAGINITGGSIVVDGNVTANGIALDGHTHPITSGSSAGNTGPSQ